MTASVSRSATPPPYAFSSSSGRGLCRQIISRQLVIDPHDYQLDGICAALDGHDLLAVTPTGSGKTGFLSMYLLVMHAIMDDPSLCSNPPRHFRKDAKIVVVCPTKSLEVDMEPKFRAAGLSTLVVNEDTVSAARMNGSDIWDHAPDVHVLLLGPEQLTTKGFETLLKNKDYQNLVVALGVDEVHLLNTWGMSFRKAFTHIGTARKRFDCSPILIALTATLRTGAPYQSVCNFLGLHAGHFYSIRRSNQRHDLQFLFRTVQSTARAFRFPELDWVLLEKRRVIVFCRTIALTFRVAMYLRARAETGMAGFEAGIEERVRMYTALNWESYNSVTLELMHCGEHRTWVTVATDTLSVGIDVANTEDVVLYDFRLPTDTDTILQKAGRIRDGRGNNSRVVIYLPKNAAEACSKVLTLVDEGAPATLVKVGKGKQTVPVDVGVAKLVSAACKVQVLDELYDNPALDPPCLCRGCSTNPLPVRPASCSCSGCRPEPVPPPRDKQKQRRKKVAACERITKKMEKHAYGLLYKYRKAERDATEDWDLLPAEEILPDQVIKTLLDWFSGIVDERSLASATLNHPPLVSRHRSLWPVMVQLRADFEQMRAKAKADSAAKSKDTRARKKAEKLALLAGSVGAAEATTGSSKGEEADGDDESVSEDYGSEDSESHQSDKSDSETEHGDSEEEEGRSDNGTELDQEPPSSNRAPCSTAPARTLRCTIIVPPNRPLPAGVIRIPPRRP